MYTRLLLLRQLRLILLVAVVTAPVMGAAAQEPDLPLDIYHNALRDLSARLGYDVKNVRLLPDVTSGYYDNSALACDLLGGMHIEPIYAFKFTLEVPGVGFYEYRIAADHSIVIPCSPELLGQSSPIYTDPNRDSDGDFIPDVRDTCPNATGHESTNGCPYPAIANDADHDLVQENGADLCPNQFGLQSNRGCPPSVQPNMPALPSPGIGDCIIVAQATVIAHSFPALSMPELFRISPPTQYPPISRAIDNVGRTWYEIQTAPQNGWVAGHVVDAFGNCDALPLNTVASQNPGGPCQVHGGAAGYVNVRSTPEYKADNSNLVGKITSQPYDVIGKDASGAWLKTAIGWVHLDSSYPMGNCTTLSVVR